LVLAAGFGGQIKTTAQDGDNNREGVEKWEYLVVSGASNTNFSPSGNSPTPKEPMGSFARESFVLEQNLDRLGAKGWELVAVNGTPADPTYHFKRRK